MNFKPLRATLVFLFALSATACSGGTGVMPLTPGASGAGGTSTANVVGTLPATVPSLHANDICDPIQVPLLAGHFQRNDCSGGTGSCPVGMGCGTINSTSGPPGMGLPPGWANCDFFCYPPVPCDPVMCGPHVPNPRPIPHPTPISFALRIYQAAYKDSHPPMTTRGLKGAPTGSECVAAIQQVLDDAHLSEVGNGTLAASTFAADLPFSGYVQTSDPVAGDIVILTDADGANHVGIMLSSGQMVSNSSSNGTFSWQDTPQNEANSTASADDGLPTGTPIFFHHTP